MSKATRKAYLFGMSTTPVGTPRPVKCDYYALWSASDGSKPVYVHSLEDIGTQVPVHIPSERVIEARWLLLDALAGTHLRTQDMRTNLKHTFIG